MFEIVNNLNNNIFTHMPFIVDDTTMFFAIGKEDTGHKNWKICCINNNDWWEIPTNLPKESVECSPTGFKYHNICYLYFLANTPEDRRYRMYGCSGPSWDNLSPAIPSKHLTYHGFINTKLQVTTIFHENYDISIKILDRKTGIQKIIVAENSFINKVSYLSEDHSKILISMPNSKELIVNSKDYTNLQMITKPRHNLYKTSIYKNICMYGEKLVGMDERRIRKTINLIYKTDKVSNHFLLDPRRRNHRSRR